MRVLTCSSIHFFFAYYIWSALRVRPLTSESLFTELHPTVTSQWQKLGELLGVDEYRLDEIYTNNEEEEECLRVMLQLWFRNPQVNVADALKTIGENQLAELLCLKCEISVYFLLHCSCLSMSAYQSHIKICSIHCTISIQSMSMKFLWVSQV